jgi:hypothetical protein
MKDDKSRANQQQGPLKKDRDDLARKQDPFKSTQTPRKDDWSKGVDKGK